MKLLGFLIIAVSLIIGVIGAMTAYLPPLYLRDDRLIGLTLLANAGRVEVEPGRFAPIARTGEVVDADMLSKLRAAHVTRIKVKEFAFVRWTQWWMFLIGCAGLFGGAMMVRNRRPSTSAQTDHGADAQSHALHTLDLIARGVAALREDIVSLSPDAAAVKVLEDLGAIQRDLVSTFIASRPQITAQRGMSGYAQVMDAFAGAERQLNRAWSAAADDVVEESVLCLERAAELIEETRRRLTGEA